MIAFNHVFDFARVAIFAIFGVGVGFMALTNWIAFRVLRPPKQIGFLWWHVTAISVTVLCLGVVAVDRVVGRIGLPPNWYGWVTLVGSVLFCVSQIIIFRVERARLVEKQALRRIDP